MKTTLAVLLVLVATFSAITALQYAASGARADLTDRDLYTLSQGTHNIIDRIGQPIEMTLYYSRTTALKCPRWALQTYDYYRYVADLLREYERAGEGKIRLEIVDPRPFSDAEEEALDAGVEAIPIAISQDGEQFENFFFGLTVRTQLGKTERIERFDPSRQDRLEYDVTKLIDDVITIDARRLGVLSPLPVRGMQRPNPMMPQQNPGWPVFDELSRTFDIVEVPVGAETIEGIDVLMVIHPKNLPIQTRWAIDQWVLAGNPTIVMVDPFCLFDQPPPQMRQMRQQQWPNSSDLPQLLSAWGLSLRNGLLVDRSLSQTVPGRGGQTRELLERLVLEEQELASEGLVTEPMESMLLLYAGGLEIRPTEGLEITTLAESTSLGRIVSKEGLNPQFAQFFIADRYEKALAAEANVPDPPPADPIPLAALVQGEATSAFPDGVTLPAEAAPDQEGAEAPAEGEKLTGLTESSSPIKVMVVADCDFYRISYWQGGFGRPFEVRDNAMLVLNTIDYLTGSEDLLSIRGRKAFRRPFRVVDELENEAEKAIVEKVEQLEAEQEELIRKRDEQIEQMRQTGGTFQDLVSRIAEVQREWDERIEANKQQIRRVKDTKRESIESLGDRLRAYNMFLAPVIILVIALILTIYRIARRRTFLHRPDGEG
jgi:ABC-type uncharacterized transport system involved in gliding motility auxiliary subunit